MINRLDTGHHKPGCIFSDLMPGRAPDREYTGPKTGTIWMTGFKINVKIKRLSRQLSFSSPIKGMLSLLKRPYLIL